MDVTKSPSPTYVAVLALASSLILVGGWLARPRETPQSAAPVPSATELEQLARRSERRSLESMTKFFADVARDAHASVAYVRAAGVTGVVWDQSRIVAAPLPGPVGVVAVEAAAAHVETHPSVLGPHLPLTVLSRSDGVPGLLAATRAPTLPQPGDWIVAVWQTGQAPAFAAGNYRQPVPASCGMEPVTELDSTLSLSRAMAGGGLFDIDGHLLAVLLPCGDRVVGVAASSIDALIDRASTVAQQVLGRYGVVFEPLSKGTQDYFNLASGLLVREVWMGESGEAAGLWPGDVITAVNGAPVVQVEDLRVLTTPEAGSFELAVRRGSKLLRLTLPFDPADGVAAAVPAGAGLILESSSRTYRIDAVAPGSSAAKAGVVAGDRLIRIDRTEPRSLDQVRRIVGAARPAPMLLEVVRGTRRLAIVVAPQGPRP